MDRVILHVDMNSYFATVEQQANPLLRGRPIAVSGRPYIHSVVAAASIEAKRFGVKSGMSTFEAKRLCPQLIFIPGDPEKYIDLTGRLIGIFKSYTPLIEVFSIDEVFLELPNHPGLPSITEALQITLEIKQRVRSEIGQKITCSIGIAKNKFLAKLASERRKPDGLTIVDESNLDEILLSSKLDDFCGIGEQILKHLQGMGVNTVAQLRQIPEDYLLAAFGVRGHDLHNMAFGIDDSLVMPDFESPEPKSFSHSLTLPRASDDRSYIEAVLLRLAEKVGRRMRQENFAGRVIHLYVRYPDMGGFGQQRALPYYTDDGYEIFTVGKKILSNTGDFPVRMMAIGISDLLSRNYLSLPLLPEKQRAEKIISSIDIVNNRFGENCLFRAAVLPAFEREKNVAGIRMRLRFN